MKKLPLFLLVLLLSPIVAFSQGTLSGTITDDESGDVLPGANIIIIGENLGAAAGLDGTYSIR